MTTAARAMPCRLASRHRHRLAAVAVAAATSATAAGTPEGGNRSTGPLEPVVRRPVALVLADDGRSLWVANARSGTLSLVDTDASMVVAEFPVGENLTDLVAGPGPDRLLALDGAGHALLVLEGSAAGLRILYHASVSPYPVRLVRAAGGARVFVSSLWSRRLDVLDVPPSAPPQRRHCVELPFAPRELVPLRDGRLLVAAAFGGEMAVVDTERGDITRLFELPIHNIRGLALGGEPEELLISHQSLSPYATTSRDDVFWGILVANRVLRIDPESALVPSGDVLRRSRGLDLGDLANPAGDPDRIAMVGKDEIAVSLGGTGRIGLGRPDWPRLDHVKVGRRPTALVAGHGRLYVANSLSDSISVIDVASRRRLHDVALGPAGERDDVSRGESLFYDAELSLRGWMSCHSCHTEGHANGAVVDTLGDGGFGAPKRVPSLLGVAHSGPWAWNGSISDLEDQVARSLHSTLGSPDATRQQIAALTRFIGTLEPPPLAPEGSAESRRRGEAVFRRSECARCHTPPSYTSARARNVGLVDEVGNRRFNPPSLRGVRHRSSFLHDGRARSLRDVFAVHGHPDNDLTETEVADLIAFLSTL